MMRIAKYIAILIALMVSVGCEDEPLAWDGLDQGDEIEEASYRQSEMPAQSETEPNDFDDELQDEFICPEEGGLEGLDADQKTMACSCPIPAGHKASHDMCRYCNALNCTNTRCSYVPIGGGTVVKTYCTL